MPLRWVLVCRTIEKKTEKSNFLLVVLANKVLFAGTVLANNLFVKIKSASEAHTF